MDVQRDPTTLVVVDDHPVVLAGMRRVLERERGFAVVAEATDVGAAFIALRVHHPRVLLLDLHLPQLVLPVLPALREAAPDSDILVLTGDADPARARECLRAGASGYQLKHSPPAELIRSVRAVAGGGRFVEPAVGAGLVALPDPPAPPDGLTAREVEVLKLLARGHTNREVAEALYLSVRTVESHRARIQLKLNRSSRAELVRYAVSRGLTHAQ